ncbi:hypothetical protein MZM54_33105 [[Brevibacterium] frigoritolerans]|nr:hypothetical protein [Peribacillus frigoritolerans]
MSEKNEIEELKKIMETGFTQMESGFNQMDRQFEGVRQEFVRVHELFQGVNSRFDNVNARLDAIKEKGKFDGEILKQLKQINDNLEGNRKSRGESYLRGDLK